MIKKKLVLVKWSDTTPGDDWKSAGEAKKWAKEKSDICYTAGWLIEDNGTYVVIASTKDEEGNFNDLNKIPKGAVKKIIPIMAIDK